MDKLTYTVGETSKLLGLSRNSTYEAIRCGQIPNIKIGHRILIPRVALLRLLNAGGYDEKITLATESVE
jgi:excisionase family DNA binding protein